MDASTGWLVLLGTVVGAAAGMIGQLVTAHFNNRSERRRLAIDAGFREWEAMRQLATTLPHPMELYPPVLFIHFNSELARLIDENRLTPDNYRILAQRRDELRDVIREDTARRNAARGRG